MADRSPSRLLWFRRDDEAPASAMVQLSESSNDNGDSAVPLKAEADEVARLLRVTLDLVGACSLATRAGSSVEDSMLS